MAPEQFKNAKEADARCDIFAMGKLVLELHKIEILPGIIGVDDLPGDLRFIAEKCIKRNPEERYQSAGDLQDNYLDLLRKDQKTKSSEQFLSMIEKQAASGAVTSDKETSALLRVLSSMNDDEIYESLPKIETPVIAKMEKLNRGELTKLVEKYVDHVSSTNWPFSATDKIGDLLMEIIQAVDSPTIHAACIRGLHDVGFDHNRWHVMGLFGSALNYISKNHIVSVPEVIKMYKDGKIKNLKDSKSYVNMSDLDKRVKEIIK